MRIRQALIGAAAVVMVGVGVGVPVMSSQAASGGFRSARAVDGDTIRLSNGRSVRLLGFDTPEVGRCGYSEAKSKMANLVSGGVKLVNVSGTDRYGRTLAYARTRDGRDVGSVMLSKGLAVARYDSRDGYPWHPKQNKYRKLDRRNGKIACTSTSKPSAPVSPPQTSVYYANCDAVRAAGKAPIRVGDPGYGRHLDRDGDGSGCE